MAFLRVRFTLIHRDKRAEVELPGSVKVGELMAECRRRWGLTGGIRFTRYSSASAVYITRYQAGETVYHAVPEGAVLSVGSDGEEQPAQGGDGGPIADLQWVETQIPQEPWRPSKRQVVLAVLIAAAALGLSVYEVRKPVPLEEAVSKGLVTAEASGGGGTDYFVLRVGSVQQRMFGLRIVVPSGLSFSSAAPGTQSMAVARTTMIDVPAGAGTHAEVRLPAYCLNRFLEAPKLESLLKLDEGGGSAPEERNPVRKLIGCMETAGTEHKVGQMAVWVVSEGLLQKPAAEVLALFRARIEKSMVAEVERKLDSPEAFAALRKQLPDIPAAKIQERIDRNKAEIARMEVQILIEQEIGKYRAQARYPLEKCGYDVASAPFFR